MRNCVLVLLIAVPGCKYINNYYGAGGDTDAFATEETDVDVLDTDVGDTDGLDDTGFAQFDEALLDVNFLGPTSQGSPPFVEEGESAWMGGISMQVFGGRVPVRSVIMYAQSRNSWFDWNPTEPDYALPPYFSKCQLFDDQEGVAIAEAAPGADRLVFFTNLVLEERVFYTFRVFCSVQSPWLWTGRHSASFYFNKWDAIETTVRFVIETTNEPMWPVHVVKLPSLDHEPGEDTFTP